MKKVFSLLLVVSICLSLCGCHKASSLPEFEIPESFDLSRNYEITFWAKNDSNKNQVNIYKEAVNSFEKLYPNIKVNIKFYTDYTTIYNDVITNIATATTPNVCITYPDHIATYLTGANIVVPLDELMSNEKYGFGGSELKVESDNALPSSDDNALNSFMKEGYLNNHYYAIPYMRSSEALYVNGTYVDKLLKTDALLKEKYEEYDWRSEMLTWDFVFDVSDAAIRTYDEVTNTYGINNQSVMIPFIYKSTDNMMIQMLQQLDNTGALYSNDDGEVLLLNDETEKVLEMISKHVTNKAFSTFKISSYPGNFINAGQCIFGIDSTAGATWIGSDAPLQDINEENIVKFETVLKMIPQFDVNNPQMISQGPSICLFNKEDNQEVLASWIFAQYLLSNNVQIAYSQTEGYLPVTSVAVQSEQYQQYLANAGKTHLVDGKDDGLYYNIKIDASKLIQKALDLDYLFITSVFNGSANVRNAAGALIEETTKAIRRKQVKDASVDQEAFKIFVNDLYENMTTLYHLDQVGVSINEKNKYNSLPTESKVLLYSLGSIWIVLGCYTIVSKMKKKK